MSYRYTSPLQYEEEEYNTNSTAPNLFMHRRPEPAMAPPSFHRRQGSSASNPRPSSSRQGATLYSRRYQMTSYPKELNDKFGALECRLCSVEATSPIGAKMHYSGKPHKKKVKSFLLEWSLKTGNPMPDLEHPTSQTSVSSVSSLADYCDLCDVRLISTNDKMLHYSGKTHRKNERDPANAKRKGKTYSTVDLSATNARFGIGIDFSSDTKPAAVVEDIKINDFVCELCDVKAVSKDQLNEHFIGKKHQEKLKKKDTNVPKPERPYKCKICDVSLETNWLLKMHLDGNPHAKAVKKLDVKYKGGQCEVCNITFTSYNHYEMHINGEKHMKKSYEKAFRTPTIVEDKKEAITCKNCPYIGNLDNHSCDRSLENIAIKDEDKKYICKPCYNMVFESKEEYEKHKKERRHLLCMLNVEGDRINEDYMHWYCFTCRKQYHSQAEFCTHLFEHKHMTLSCEEFIPGNKTDLWFCSVCSIIMDQEVMNEHMKSKSHLMLAKQQEITKILTAMATEELGTQTFYCSHCDSKFFNFVAYSEHLLDPKTLEEIISTKFAT